MGSEYNNPIYNGSQGSQLGDAVQPSNFNFAPLPRTAGGAFNQGVGGLGATNMLSDADFERANTDIEDNDDDQSYYVEEEVTDEEAMAQQKKDLGLDDEDDDSDESMGGYMPSMLGGSSTPAKQKPKKITKKIRVKKKKTVSGKKPPRQASPPLGRARTAAPRIGSTDNIQRKS